MPIYMAVLRDSGYSSDTIHAEGIADADREAFKLYGERLEYVVLAPRCLQPKNRQRYVKPPSTSKPIFQLAKLGVFGTPAWRVATATATMPPAIQRLVRHLQLKAEAAK